MTENSDIAMSQPGMDKTGPVPVKPPVDSIPVEQLRRQAGSLPPCRPGADVPDGPGRSAGPASRAAAGERRRIAGQRRWTG